MSLTRAQSHARQTEVIARLMSDQSYEQIALVIGVSSKVVSNLVTRYARRHKCSGTREPLAIAYASHIADSSEDLPPEYAEAAQRIAQLTRQQRILLAKITNAYKQNTVPGKQQIGLSPSTIKIHLNQVASDLGDPTMRRHMILLLFSRAVIYQERAALVAIFGDYID